MELEFSTPFVRDLRRIRHQDLRDRVERAIGELEAASTITDVPSVTRINSASGHYYRIRIGDYRLGIAVDGNVVILVRFLHRRDIYRYFP